MSIVCGSKDHAFVINFATWAAVFYIAVVPACFGGILWSERAEITSRESRHGHKSIKGIAFLFR